MSGWLCIFGHAWVRATWALKDFLCPHLGVVCRAFSCLLCCFEFQLKQVAYIISNNFGFLYDAKSRMIFLIL